LQVTFERRYWP